MIEHVGEPLTILELMRGAIENAPNARFFLETPDVEWILEHRVVWDFFYEHCSYFTPRSIQYAAALSGLELDRVDLVFGGQYMWAQGRPAQVEPVADAQLRPLAEAYEQAELELWQRLAGQLDELASRGPVVVWGAGAKGVTFANQLDPEATILAGIVDLNPAKQGGFLPGTAHPIFGPDQLAELGVTSAVLMNPNYEQEIREMLASANSSIDLVHADQQAPLERHELHHRHRLRHDRRQP